jgi:hypothetical protein
MAPKAPGLTSAANMSQLRPTVEDDSNEETEDDEEMDDDDDGGDRPRPLHDELDEALAGAILELAEKPNATVAFVVADEMMTRLRELRERANNGKKTEENNKGIDSAIQEAIAERVAKVVKREV